jgi:hypothetical protein
VIQAVRLTSPIGSPVFDGRADSRPVTDSPK